MFTPSSVAPAIPSDILLAVSQYLRSKRYTTGVVEDKLYRMQAVSVTLTVDDLFYTTFFVLDGDSLVVQNNNTNSRKRGPVFPLADPQLFERLVTYLEGWYNTISQFAALQHQCEDASRQSQSDSI